MINILYLDQPCNDLTIINLNLITKNYQNYNLNISFNKQHVTFTAC